MDTRTVVMEKQRQKAFISNLEVSWGRSRRFPTSPMSRIFVPGSKAACEEREQRKGFLLDWRETDEESLFSRNKHGGSGQKTTFPSISGQKYEGQKQLFCLIGIRVSPKNRRDCFSFKSKLKSV